jgi:uncharacterized protein with PIN domain
MNREDLRTRMRRLEELTAGLAKEASLWRECDAPILFVDRQEYLEAIEEAVSALQARVTLARVCQELESKPGA